MANNYISPSMIPMNEIAEYLETVKGFGKKTENAQDVDNVNKVKAELIAVAATNEDGTLAVDRETVKNTLKLNGIDASKYLTVDNANSLLVDTYKVSTNNSDEIKNLRDELYQIKASLIKNGMIHDNPSYNGFVEAFRENNKKYISDAITVTNTDNSSPQINSIFVEDSSDFVAGEYIVIGTSDVQISRIHDVVGNRVDLSTSVAGPIPVGTEIKKTYGSYNNGSFVFGEVSEMAVDSKEKYIILNDDAQVLLLQKKYTANSGYAAHINIPSTANGILRRVGVQARVFGKPGSLRCYVVKSNNNISDILAASSIDELKKSDLIVGESDFIHSSQATQAFNELYFDFSEPVLLSDNNYIFLFVQIDADTDNHWDLKGLRGKEVIDLQTNSSLYSFSDGIGFVKEDGDLYLIVVTSDVTLNKLQHQKRGLYSCKFDLKATTATRVRVELKINREGRFRVVDEPLSLLPGPDRALVTYNEDNKSYPSSLFSTGDLIAIGSNLATVGTNRNGNTSFTLEEAVYAPSSSEVYRIGYTVQVKACNKSYDINNQNAPIVIEDVILKELSPVAIIPGKEAGLENSSSDRIIFEAELELQDKSNISLKNFNNIEVQVFWENNSLTTMDLNNMPELAGTIYDIVITTDNAYNTKNTSI